MNARSDLESLGLLPGSASEVVHPTPVPSYFLHKPNGVRAVVGITCVFSMLGSALIILSYLFFRDLRTNARLLLVHLAISDFAVSLANLSGDVVRFDRYFNWKKATISYENDLSPAYIDSLCKFQAFMAHYFTISSVLWTLMLAVYMYVVTTKLCTLSVKENKTFNLFGYLFCYGMSLLVTVWMICTDKLGYSPYNTAGWCGTIVHNIITEKKDYFVTILGYDLWIVMTSFFIIVIYLSLHLYIKKEVCNKQIVLIKYISKDVFIVIVAMTTKR